MVCLGVNRISMEYTTQCGGRRADLVIYKGDHTRKSEMEFLCLVEFKVGSVDNNDLQKIVDWFQFIDSCRYGAICTAMEMPQKEERLSHCRNIAQTAGRIPVYGRVARPLWSQQGLANICRDTGKSPLQIVERRPRR